MGRRKFGCRFTSSPSKKNQQEEESGFITYETLSTEQMIFQNDTETLK